MPKKKQETRKVQLPTMSRAATFSPKSIDREARTVDVIWTTGARVFRRGFFEDFHEELGLENKNVRMKRLTSGTAPVLDNHGNTDKRGVAAAIGVVVSATLEPGKRGVATLRFSKRAAVDEIFQDIEDGIIRNISVGYNVFRAEQVGEEKDGNPILRAVDWEPVEISVVPAGADAKSVIRSSEDIMHDLTITRNVETIKETPEEIPEETSAEQRNEPGLDEPNSITETERALRENKSTGEINMPTKEEIAKKEKADLEIRTAAKLEEKTRQTEIRSIVSKVKLEARFADEYIKDDKTIDEVRTLVIDQLAKEDENDDTNTRSTNGTVVMGEDLGRAGRIEGMTSALLHKFRPQSERKVEQGQTIILPGYELVESGREYAYLSLTEMARHCLESQGIRTGMMPKHAIADMALNNTRAGLHSTSDFPEILANVVNKTLRNGYLAAPQTFMPFTTENFVSDFKEISRINLGDAPSLLKVPEGGEVKRGTMSEAAEKYRVEEYARIFALTRKTIVNDDLSAFTRVPERMGRRAKDLESDVVWDVVKLNAAMADTFALFSAQHGNLSTVPAAPSETGLNEMRAAMRRQTGLDGAPISLIPAHLFVPPAHETVTEKLLAATRPNNASDINPFGPQGRTTLDFDVEPRLESGTGGSLTGWFGTADKGQVDMIELSKLEGTNGPQVSTRDGFDVAGLEIKISHDVAAKSIDHRGLWKNAGA